MIGRGKLWLLVFWFSGCTLAASSVAGQDEKIPSAQQVIEAYIDALGGEMNLRAVEAVSVTARSEHLFGPDSSVTVYWKNGKLLIEDTCARADEKVNVQRFGFDGEYQWQKLDSRRAGRKHKKTPRLLLRLEEYGVTPYALELLSFEGTVTQNGKSDIFGRSNWHLTFVWPNGQKDDRYFDIESGLLTRVETTYPRSSSGGFGGGGVAPLVLNWQDRTNGSLLTLKESTRVGTNSEDLRTQIDSASFDAEIEDAEFEIPEDVRDDDQ